MSGRLDGNRVLAVGCGQGFGAASALHMAEAGAEVIVADVDRGKANATAQQIVDAGARASGLWVDIALEDAIRDLVA
jgi:NAD(P)-dependent dehydrogenase (short-subunit alcohol dehydrogenase family)